MPSLVLTYYPMSYVLMTLLLRHKILSMYVHNTIALKKYYCSEAIVFEAPLIFTD